MDENYESQKEPDGTQYNHNHGCDTSACWLKYLVISLAAFFGAFLAVYFVADQIVHRYIIPAPPHFIPMHRELSEKDVAKLIKDQEKMQERIFYDIETAENQINPFAPNLVKVDTYKSNNAYVITIDLKPFNNNPDNIKMDIKPRRIKLSGFSNEVKKGADEEAENEVSFMQNFSFPKKIDVDDVKKEVKGNKYIITLPID